MSPKQRAFVDAYLRLGTAMGAAREAGYAESFVNKRASTLLQNPQIVEEIKRRRAALNQKAEKSATDVVNEYAKIAFTDRVDFLMEDPLYEGQYIYKPPDQLTQEQRDLVERVHINNIYSTNQETGERTFVRQLYSYTLLDKKDALQQMGRHFGIFDDKLKLTGVQQNPFKNATPEQLKKLRESFVNVMSDGRLIEGTAHEVKK